MQGNVGLTSIAKGFVGFEYDQNTKNLWSMRPLRAVARLENRQGETEHTGHMQVESKCRLASVDPIFLPRAAC